MTQDNIGITERYTARSDVGDRLAALEREVSQMRQIIIAMGRAATGLQTPPPQLPMSSPVPLLTASNHLHFGLDAQLRAHWADVYSRLVTAGKLHSNELSSTNFTYLLCGVGTPPLGPIHWYGTTRELAYMVRRHLNSRWDVAPVWFKDHKDNPLPKSFPNTKPPCDKSAAKLDLIFRKKD